MAYNKMRRSLKKDVDHMLADWNTLLRFANLEKQECQEKGKPVTEIDRDIFYLEKAIAALRRADKEF